MNDISHETTADELMRLASGSKYSNEMNKDSAMTTDQAPTTSPTRGTARELVRRLHPARAGALYALILIVFTFQFLTAHDGLPSFLSVSNVRNLLDQAALDGMLVVSMTVCSLRGTLTSRSEHPPDFAARSDSPSQTTPVP